MFIAEEHFQFRGDLVQPISDTNTKVFVVPQQLAGGAVRKNWPSTWTHWCQDVMLSTCNLDWSSRIAALSVSADTLVRMVNVISSIRQGTSITIAWFSRSRESLMIEWNMTSSVERRDAGKRKFLVQIKKWFESKDEISTAQPLPLRLIGRSGKLAKVDSWGMKDHSVFAWKWKAKSISTAAGRYRRTVDVWQWQEILIDKQRATCMDRSIVDSCRFLWRPIRGNRSLKDVSCSLFIVFSASNDEHWYARLHKRMNHRWWLVWD